MLNVLCFFIGSIFKSDVAMLIWFVSYPIAFLWTGWWLFYRRREA